jgi:two-component system, chemotaxis family, CheB/CheR fusion protein
MPPVTSNPPFPIVGVGASAGGVEALEGFFRGMPPQPGMAFVVVTHMPRGYETTLPEILGRYTEMPVTNAHKDEAIEPNHVYVCPSDHVLTVRHDRLHLEPRGSEIHRTPIDVFLSSLAQEHGEYAVGVVLSGGGSDGTLGIKAIKEHGGLTLAQGTDASGPRQSSMPEAAIATGLVDLVIPVEAMGARLVSFAERNRGPHADAREDQAIADDVAETQKTIAAILKDQVGHDFSGYKQKTFMRRVRRRMDIVQMTDLAGYVERLRREPDEVTLLFRDLLIGVTNFFRDNDAFEALESLVIPRVFQGKGAADTVRIWVPGCATGEEVYSIAMLVREHMDTLRGPPKIQIFATDIDEPALNIARAGRYPRPLVQHIKPARLERFFVRDDATYIVAKGIRDLCIFSAHSVIRDPPFSRIDLISCRNLLIYLGAGFQARVIPIFHFALKPGGFLFLGTSENISQHADLFQRVDGKQRLFQRRDHVVSPLQFPAFTPGARFPASGTEERHDPGGTASLRRAVETRVLEQFAPAHVVVNREGDIVHYSARTGKYLEPAAGMPSRQLLAAARMGLRLELRAALQEAIETRRAAVRDPILISFDDRMQAIRLTVEPLRDHETDPLFLVLFTDLGAPEAPSEAAARHAAGEANTEQLERELRDTRERLQSTIEEYETALEELKAANEEMVSVNEELQSANEELETSKEEMQSINEELQTVNAELNGKVEEVDRAHADLRNLFESTQIGAVFLDDQLVIRSFTPAIAPIFNLISTDRGRPLTDIVSHIENGDLRREIRVVLERGETIERRVRQAESNTHYLMRILPYRGRNNAIDGVVLTFVDVTGLVAAEAQQRAMVEELNHRVRNMLAVVSAMAHQTIATSASPKAFLDAFTARIQAMARTYGLVSRDRWSEVALNEVFATALAPYQAKEHDRVHIDGPAIALRPAAALALGMVAHELATNAVKYGALSNAKGEVSVSWALETRSGEQLVIHWTESGGPATKKKVERGFGSRLIEMELKTLRGTAKIEYASSGVRAVLSMPADPALLADR